jgi:hypothetical protein
MLTAFIGGRVVAGDGRVIEEAAVLVMQGGKLVKGEW